VFQGFSLLYTRLSCGPKKEECMKLHRFELFVEEDSLFQQYLRLRDDWYSGKGWEAKGADGYDERQMCFYLFLEAEGELILGARFISWSRCQKGKMPFPYDDLCDKDKKARTENCLDAWEISRFVTRNPSDEAIAYFFMEGIKWVEEQTQSSYLYAVTNIAVDKRLSRAAGNFWRRELAGKQRKKRSRRGGRGVRFVPMRILCPSLS
jgi:N-acyl-L-homoserine lactone synthetase